MRASKNFPVLQSTGKTRFLSKIDWIEDNFKVTKHFLDRMLQRGISITEIYKALRYGANFYYLRSDMKVTIKYVYNGLLVVTRSDVVNGMPTIITCIRHKMYNNAHKAYKRMNDTENEKLIMANPPKPYDDVLSGRR